MEAEEMQHRSAAAGLLGSLLLLLALVFIDWRTLIQRRKLRMEFRIFN